MQRWSGVALPVSCRKLVVHTLSPNFRSSTEIRDVAIPTEVKPTEVIVRNEVVGINASDINFTAGVYKPGVKPPFDAGFEALGRIVAVGSQVSSVALGDTVVSQAFGAFTEYQVVSQRNLRKVPDTREMWLPLEISATTASIALERIAPLKGETALVTAAAGGTGQFAVQLLSKVYGCHVIGTCSTDDKAAYLKNLGCHRVVNYKREDLSEVLSTEYTRGVHVVYESVGGSFFDTAVHHLALKGRLLVLGNIAGYQTGESFRPPPGAAAQTSAVGSSSSVSVSAAATRPPLRQPIGTTLLQKSASVVGFFLPHFQKQIPDHWDKLRRLVEDRVIVSGIDEPAAQRFRGITAIPDAVEYLHAGSNTGKVIVRLLPAL